MTTPDAPGPYPGPDNPAHTHHAADLATELNTELRTRSVENLGDMDTVAAQLRTALENQYGKHQNIQLSDIGEMQQILSRLGLADTAANKMYGSWASYDERLKIIHGKNRAVFALPPDESYAAIQAEISKLSPDEIDQAMSDKITRMLQKLGSVMQYAHDYGPDELQEVNRVFDTLDFSHYLPGQLHSQLEQWNSPQTVPVQSIAALTTKDWNGSNDRAGMQLRYLLGARGNFIFETGSKLALARMSKNVGNRERQAGRDPLTASQLKYLIIKGHSSPDGIQLGPDENLDIKAYVEAATNRQKLGNNVKTWNNTFEQDLGSRYTLILPGCRGTGESVTYNTNIAEVMHQVHNARVAASRGTNYGLLIEPDGGIYFIDEQDSADDVPAVMFERDQESKRPTP